MLIHIIFTSTYSVCPVPHGKIPFTTLVNPEYLFSNWDCLGLWTLFVSGKGWDLLEESSSPLAGSWRSQKDFRESHASAPTDRPIPPCPAGRRQKAKWWGWLANWANSYRLAPGVYSVDTVYTCWVYTQESFLTDYKLFVPLYYFLTYFLFTYHTPESRFPTWRSPNCAGSFLFLWAQKLQSGIPIPALPKLCDYGQLIWAFLKFSFLTCKVGIMRIYFKGWLPRNNLS